MTKVEHIVQREHPKTKVWKDHSWISRGKTEKECRDEVAEFIKHGIGNYRLIKRTTTIIDEII